MRSAKILVVDDNPSLTELLPRMLQVGLSEEFKVTVTVAGNVHETLQAIHNGLDLLIIDYGLPDGSGIEVIKQSREKGLTFPVMLISGHRLSFDPHKDKSYRFLTKPFHLEEFVGLARRLLMEKVSKTQEEFA